MRKVVITATVEMNMPVSMEVSLWVNMDEGIDIEKCITKWLKRRNKVEGITVEDYDITNITTDANLASELFTKGVIRVWDLEVLDSK